MSKRKSRKSKQTKLDNSFVLPVYKNPPDIPPSHAHVLMVKQPKQ